MLRRQHKNDAHPDWFAATFNDKYMEIYDSMFLASAKRVFVHELGHVWDKHNGERCWQGMRDRTKNEKKKPDGEPEEVDYKPSSPGEDFASAVATAIYGLEWDKSSTQQSAWMQSERRKYANALFACEKAGRKPCP